MSAKFIAPVKRRNYGRGHGYVDGNGQKMPGVTTILGKGVPKEALINWAANATAGYAVDHWDELSDKKVAERLKELEGARYKTTDKAKKRGTEVHGYGERLVKGEKVTGVPEELRGHVEGYVKFLDQFDVEPIAVEFTIASYRFGYAGTADLIAELTDGNGERATWLLDLKTNEKGIYGETALQLAAYRYADVYLDENGKEQPMIEVQRTGAIHITSSDVQLIPTDSGETSMRVFRYAQQMAQFAESSRDLVGPAVQPPETEKAVARVVWEETAA